MKKILQFLLITIVAIPLCKNASAQSEVYFREGFNEGQGTIPSSAAASVPGQYHLQNNSGTWYTYGVYRSNGPTGSCETLGGLSHIRFANLNSITTTNDSAYIITPVVNYGINTISYYNGRAGRRFTIHKTADTSATTTNWTFVAFYTTDNVACQFYQTVVNDPTAKRIRIMARAGTDSDLDSIVMTSTSIILPVKFSSFNALETSGKVKLNWNMATELNTANYVVERSSNGVTFTSAASLDATQTKGYSWIDNAPVNGTNYYRIKGVDKDGAFMYSSVVRVNVGGRKDLAFTIAPNPVRGRQVNLQVANLNKGTYQVNVFNGVGQQVYSRSITHSGGSTTFQLELPAAIRSGIYNIQMKDGETVLNKKLVIE